MPIYILYDTDVGRHQRNGAIIMKKTLERIKYWGQLLLLPLYWFSFLFPRSKRIWLFGSTFGRRFADNPRYFYLYVNYYRKDLRPIWISHDKEIVRFLQEKEYEAYYYHSLKGIWFALIGKVYLFDNYSKDINFWQSGGAVKINMWHGIPLKKIQADNIFDKVRHPKNAWEKWKSFPRRLSDEKPSHYVLTTSEFMKPIFESAFQTKHVLTTGYPRVDSFAFDKIKNIYTKAEETSIEKIKSLKKADKNSKIIYYMPTFRDSETEFFDVMDLEGFERFLREKHLIFCTKLHPKSKLREQFKAMEGGNLVNIDADTDPYVFIPMSDILVTDYSSIYFDYLFTDKPIVFFNYDLETYLKDSREMYFDYEEYTPGIKAANQKELEEAFCKILDGEDGYEEERLALQKKIFDVTEENVSQYLAKEIKASLRR